MTKFATIKLIVATSITNINTSLTIISMRAIWHHFYIGLACHRFNSAFYGTFYFVKGPIMAEHNILHFD